tara:strand:+ start:4413 stop:4640 length:228 start_codon:yes stop_codon:yes gene_type:complete
MDHEVGDIVYIKPSAEKGFLEKIAIKKIVTENSERTNFQDYILIYGTNNRRFFPEELISLTAAQTLITAVVNPPC